MIPFSPEDQLGPAFKVEESSKWLGPESNGWIVSLRGADLAVWTGGHMTLREAGDILLLRHYGTSQSPPPSPQA